MGNSEGHHRGDRAGMGKIPRRRGKIRLAIAKQEPNLLELIFVAGLSGISRRSDVPSNRRRRRG
jgi:hypothetical protein